MLDDEANFILDNNLLSHKPHLYGGHDRIVS